MRLIALGVVLLGLHSCGRRVPRKHSRSYEDCNCSQQTDVERFSQTHENYRSLANLVLAFNSMARHYLFGSSAVAVSMRQPRMSAGKIALRSSEDTATTVDRDAAAVALHELVMAQGQGVALCCQPGGKACSWERVELRPAGASSVEVTYIDSAMRAQRKYNGEEVPVKIAQILEQQPGAVQKVIGSDSKGSNDGRSWLLGALPAKKTPLRFLQALRIMDDKGWVNPKSVRKLKQIQGFLRNIFDVGPSGVSLIGLHKGEALGNDLRGRQDDELVMVDFGCGAAHLTFAMHHVLEEALGTRLRSIGIDRQSHLINNHGAVVQKLGWPMRFENRQILGSALGRVDVAVALHACDTATDDALVEALSSGAQLIYIAPCCHKNLQRQMLKVVRPQQVQTPGLPNRALAASVALVRKDNIIRQRVGDILTDEFRVMLLRMMGYRVDVIEFVDTEHSPKNLLIRAARSDLGQMTDSDGVHARRVEEAQQDYVELKAAWGVVPHLEGLLRERCTVLERQCGDEIHRTDACHDFELDFVERVNYAFLDGMH